MVSHLFPLCSPYLYRECGVSVVLHGVVTGWTVRQGLSCLSHEIIFYNFHVRILEAKFITRDLQWNILLSFGTMEETAAIKTNWIWTDKRMSHILHRCFFYLQFGVWCLSLDYQVLIKDSHNESSSNLSGRVTFFPVFFPHFLSFYWHHKKTNQKC